MLPDKETLANEFSIVIREWLPEDMLRNIDARNLHEKDSTICHSHDYCDPNQAMIDAFARFEVELDMRNPEHANAVDEAWAIAKKNGFASSSFKDMPMLSFPVEYRSGKTTATVFILARTRVEASAIAMSKIENCKVTCVHNPSPSYLK